MCRIVVLWNPQCKLQNVGGGSLPIDMQRELIGMLSRPPNHVQAAIESLTRSP